MAIDSLPRSNKPIKSIGEYNKDLLPYSTDKYGINVPKYLTKVDLKKRLVKGLVAQDYYDEFMLDKVNQATVKVTKEMLEENGLNSDPYYTKERMVEMMIETFCQLNSFIINHLARCVKVVLFY